MSRGGRDKGTKRDERGKRGRVKMGGAWSRWEVEEVKIERIEQKGSKRVIKR